MPSDTDAPAPTAALNFHQDFDTPSTAAILQTPDGTCFRFDLGVLALFSSFFAGLKSLPRSGDDEDQIIPLPSTTRDALHFTLSAIKATLRGRAPAIPVDEDLCDALLETADAYDLPVIYPSLLRRAEADNGVAPGTCLVIALLAHDKRAVEHYSLQVLTDDSDYRPALTRALEAREPDAARMLAEHGKTWQSALDDFEAKAARTTRFGFQSAFDDSCIGIGGGDQCDEYIKWRGEIVPLVRREAAACRKKLAFDPSLMAGRGYIYTPNTSCLTCRDRIQRIINWALEAAIPASVYMFNLE